MKAIYTKEFITVIDLIGNGSAKIYNTDVYNVSYCLSRYCIPSCLKSKNFEFYKFQDYVISVLKEQKSIRAVCQKFNAICKALEL